MLAAAGDTQQVYDSDIKLIPPHELDSKKTQTYRRFWVRSTTDRYHLHAGLTRFETGDFRTPDFPILESAKFCVTSMYDQVWSRRRGLFKNRIDLVDSWIIFIQRHQSKLIKCYDRALTVNHASLKLLHEPFCSEEWHFEVDEVDEPHSLNLVHLGKPRGT